jgi:hypothetical protein
VRLAGRVGRSGVQQSCAESGEHVRCGVAMSTGVHEAGGAQDASVLAGGGRGDPGEARELLRGAAGVLCDGGEHIRTGLSEQVGHRRTGTGRRYRGQVADRIGAAGRVTYDYRRCGCFDKAAAAEDRRHQHQALAVQMQFVVSPVGHAYLEHGRSPSEPVPFGNPVTCSDVRFCPVSGPPSWSC